MPSQKELKETDLFDLARDRFTEDLVPPLIKTFRSREQGAKYGGMKITV